jgi:serine/threonine protein kinase/Tfp pilus assembly protein PilF
MIGKTISHYQILEKLGTGGMGVVYKAEDTKLKRTVAIKFLPPELTRDPEAKARFIREAQAASSLQHNNICTIHEIDETEDGQIFICMDYYEGETLKDKIKDKRLKTKEAIDISIQIAQGLEKAHEKGIIHRDIKPANILITNDGIAKILDFGLAKLTGQAQLTKDASTLGTVAYMSPEQCSGTEVDQRTDIWSLGVVLYEMLTGELPFKGDYEQAVMYAILNEESKPLIPEEPGRIGNLIDLQRIIDKALATRPDEQYHYVHELLSDLNNASREQDSKETPSNYKKAFQKRGKKWTVFYAGFALLIVVIVLMAVFFIQIPETEIIDSIAVLPMENISNNPELEFLTDGMTEAMIAELAKIEALRVISRTSIMRYKNSEKSLPDIAGELNVDAVLEGSAVIFSDQIRITAQLIKAKTDEHIWVKQYDSDLKDVLSLYSEVAKDIAQQIKIKLTPDDEQRLAGAKQVDPEAYRLYIEGMKYRYLEGDQNYQWAAAQFTKAVEIDPDFALAYARLALCYSILKGIYGLPGEEIVLKAREALNKSIELNDKLSEVYVALGLFQVLINKDWVEAEKSFRQAIQLNPGSIEPHLELGHLLTRYGNNLDEAFAEYRLAKELDPVSVRAASAASGAYFQIGDYDKVIELCSRRLEIEPKQRIVRVQLGWAYIFKGDPQKGLNEFKKLLASERDAVVLGGVGFAYGILGIEEKAQKTLIEVKKEWPESQWIQALIEAGLGNWESYLNHLEQKWEKNQRRSVFHLGSPFFDPVRSDPRFIALMEKMGIKK